MGRACPLLPGLQGYQWDPLVIRQTCKCMQFCLINKLLIIAHQNCKFRVTLAPGKPGSPVRPGSPKEPFGPGGPDIPRSPWAPFRHRNITEWNTYTVNSILIRCQYYLNCNVPLVLAVRQHQGILCYQELPGSHNMSQFSPCIILIIFILIITIHGVFCWLQIFIS